MRGIERLFREDVPEDLIIEFFAIIGVKEKSDCKWWSKEVFTPDVKATLCEMLPILEPYYYPHKSFIVRREMSELRFIQIYRQLAMCMGYRLDKREAKGREVYKRKTTLYRLARDHQQESTPSIVVEFK
jgi:hypothetical protein